jgi:DNA (cytosine-5)-methyltransferase 1
MTSWAYYNEINPEAAHVMREQIARGVIAPGFVDERSIKDVQPDDLLGFSQQHFFAGGGFWSVAARLAGWPDDKPLCTGSCPCQAESLAGKRLGAADPRDLWPDFRRIIRATRPPVVVGEQVAAAIGSHWLDRTLSDLDADHYAARAVSVPACAVNAPHERARLYWIAVDSGFGFRCSEAVGESRDDATPPWERPANCAERSHGVHSDIQSNAPGVGRREGRSKHGFRSGRGSVADVDALVQPDTDSCGHAGWPEDAERGALGGTTAERAADGLCADADGSFWSDYEWIVSPLDGKARRAKPGIPFLVNGLPGRVDLWRIGGNAIIPQLAAEVLKAYLETENQN